MTVTRGFPRRWAIAFYVALFAVTGSILIWMHATRSKPDALSQEERQDLAEVDDIGGKRIRHPLLGFSLLHPGPKFFLSREAEDKIGFEHDTSTRFHVFTELDSGRMVIVALSRRQGIDAGGFTAAVDSISRMYLQKTAAGFETGAAIDTIDHRIDGQRREASIHMRIAGKGHLRLRARAARFAGSTDYLLVLIAVSPTDDSLAPVLDSFEPAAGP